MSSEASAVTSASMAAPRPRRVFSVDNRFLPPLLITCILLAAHLSFGVLESYARTALAIGTAITAELIIGRITYGYWPDPASAYITGISLGRLIRSPVYSTYALMAFILL